MKLTLLFGIIFIWAGSARAQQSGVLQITNPGSTTLSQTLVEIPWATVLTAYPTVDTAQLRVTEVGSGREVPYQLERRGQKNIRNLLVQVTIAPKQRLRLALRREPPTPVPPKTYCRYVPERYDDFAWENDRIAFRIYGKALNGRKDNAYGTDVWAKRTDKLILNDWYKRNDYHKDNGEGLDYYHVGFTLGAGDIGVWLGDSIHYVHNYTNWAVLDNGPLRSTFRVGYPAYTFGKMTVNTTKIISLDAGSQLSRIEVRVTHNAPQPLPMVVGINLRPEPGLVFLSGNRRMMSYWEPTHGADGTLGIGCVFPTPTGPMQQAQHHALAPVNLPSNEPFVYYSGAAWDKAGAISSAAAWVDYLQQRVTQLEQPPIVTIKRDR